jgi:hypothetical protein
VLGGRLEDTMRSRWKGAWVLLKAEAASGCDGSFTNNSVSAGRIIPAGGHRLGVGELGRVDNVHVKRQRVDVLIGLAEPLLIAFSDGPFDLVRQDPCRIELQFATPRGMIKAADASAIDQILGTVLERHVGQDSAMASALYNGRQVEPFPRDWEDTLAAYEEWKREQVYAQIADRLGRALEEAVRITNRVKTGAAYGDGLAAGMRGYHGNLSGKDCPKLAEKSFYASGGSVPSDYSGSSKKDWQNGHREGQLLAFNVDLAERLESCLH